MLRGTPKMSAYRLQARRYGAQLLGDLPQPHGMDAISQSPALVGTKYQ